MLELAMYGLGTLAFAASLAFVVGLLLEEYTTGTSYEKLDILNEHGGRIFYTNTEYVCYDIKNDCLVVEDFQSVATARYIFSPDYVVLGEL